MKMKVALIQYRPKIGQMETNIDHIGKLSDKAVGSRLIVLPELAASIESDITFQVSKKLMHFLKI